MMTKLTVANFWTDRDLVSRSGTGSPSTLATFAIEAGIALPVVQQMLGHSDIRVTQGYVTVSSELAADAARRMGRLLREPPPEG